MVLPWVRAVRWAMPSAPEALLRAVWWSGETTLGAPCQSTCSPPVRTGDVALGM
jgi:hypothetical protein